MFGSGSLFRDFDEDPFFSDFHRRHRQQMSSMFGDFGMGFGHNDPFLAITDGRHLARPSSHHQSRSTQPSQHQQQQHHQMAPFGMFDMFSNMNHMMADMHRNFDGMASNPNSHTYSHSSFTSYSNSGGGAPNVYQSTSSTRQAPGGIKETRKTVRDSAAGVEKMSVGHHIHDRSHTIKKARNSKSNDVEEEQEFVNLDETEASEFDEEWQTKTRNHRPAIQARTHHPGRRYSPAITDGRTEPKTQSGEQRRKRPHAERSDVPEREHARPHTERSNVPEREHTRVRINSQPEY